MIGIGCMVGGNGLRSMRSPGRKTGLIDKVLKVIRAIKGIFKTDE